MFRSASLFSGTSFPEAVFTIFATSNVDSIVGNPHKLYSMQNNFYPHKKPISLLNVPICTQGMQRTWWPEVGTIIVTGPYSLWPTYAIWRHKSGSTLVQVMACCLMAPSHYLNQRWLIISKVCGIHMRAISQKIPQPSITKISLKITYLKFYSTLPGANKLKFQNPKFCILTPKITNIVDSICWSVYAPVFKCM